MTMMVAWLAEQFVYGITALLCAALNRPRDYVMDHPIAIDQ